MKTGIVILTGGKNTRMGLDKSRLQIRSQTFLQRLTGEFADFDEKLLSTGELDHPRFDNFTNVADIYQDAGPMAGIHAALSCCQSDALLAVACDMPLVTRAFGGYLLRLLSDPQWEAVVPVTRDGRAHYFCAAYRKSIVSLFEAQLSNGLVQMRRTLEKAPVLYAELSKTPYTDELLTNINTPEEYRRLLTSVTHAEQGALL